MLRVTEFILNQLLDRFEQPQRQQVVRVRLNDKEHAAYFSATDGNARRAVNAELQALEQQGIVHLHWRKWEIGNWLAAVDLETLRADFLYTQLKRAPHNEQANALRELLRVQVPRADWHAAFVSWANAQLDTHRAVSPLALDDETRNAELLRALDAIAQLDAPVLERMLSVRLFNDSKAFENLRGAVLTVLRRFDDNAALYGDDDGVLLRAHFVERAPEYVPLAGLLILCARETRRDLALFAPSVALPANVLRATERVETQAHVVITVENAASFTELAAYAHAQNFIAVYIGGFASPSVLAFLKTLAASHLTLLHWGDLDVGGLRILAHLRKNIGAVKTLGMDAEIFVSHQTFARALNARERGRLEILQRDEWLRDCAVLIDTMLAANQKLEQEAVRAETILRTLQRDSV
jgi:hypothetical protein